MSRGAIRLGLAAAGLAALAGVLVVLFVNARHKGKLSYCRNNLRRLGTMVHADRLNLAEHGLEERGRAFWQYYRETAYHNPLRKEWIRKGSLNPFGCPVYGHAPTDLMELDPAEYAKHMSDPSTIDYAGPRETSFSGKGRRIIGADRPVNHGTGGYALLVDLSVAKQDEAVGVSAESWQRALEETAD